MKRLFVFGRGYTAGAIARGLRARGWAVAGTGSGGIAFDDEEQVRAALARVDHVLSSVPPGEGDPVLTRYGDALGHGWLGYLSSTGVYGDTGGAWVDESAKLVGQGGGSGRRSARTEADQAWLERGARVFRLPGIYGPPIDKHKARSPLDRVRQGKAHRIDLPDQVFSRVHVADIASGVIAALAKGSAAPPGAYNLADDLPCSQNAVIEEACRLLGLEPPVLQSLDQAGLSPAARGFYAENRRVANGKARRVLGWKPRYPTYREGLRSLI
jgi:nucleoside-diphosphate-sugar epimerase